MKKLILALSLLLSPMVYAQTTPSVNFRSLNFNDSFTIVKGNGSRKLALFEDPNCPYCKQFEGTLARLNNVTLYIFLYPILGDDSVQKSTSIWCSENRSYVWQNWMINHAAFAPKTCSTTPVFRNMALGKSYGFNGTPTVVFEDGTKEVGAITSEQIETKFTSLYGGYKPSTSSSPQPVATPSGGANPFK
jgi:thiol:disulfide interchange protein DsbC